MACMSMDRGRRVRNGGMKYLPLVWAALWRRKTRTILTFLSVVIALVLFGVLSGLSGGFAHVLGSARLDRLLVDPRIGTPLPITYADQIARIPGVTVVEPLAFLPAYYKDPRNPIAMDGIDAQFFAARPEVLASKKQIQAMTDRPTNTIIGVGMARRYGFKVGDEIPLISGVPTRDGDTNWTFKVVAIVKNSENPNGSNTVLINYQYLDQRRVTSIGTATRILVRIDDPAQAAQISARIDEMFANSPAPTRTGSEKSNAQSGVQSLGDIDYFTHAILGAVLFTLLFLIGNSMMQSVRERVPEFAVMKTLGFSDGTVLALVLAEAVLMCVLAGLAGLALVKGILPLVADNAKDPLVYELTMSWSAFAQGLVFALVISLLSAMYPAMLVQRLSVVDALRR